MLLCALMLTLLAVAVESGEVFFGPVIGNTVIEHSEVRNTVDEYTDLDYAYESPVVRAEKVMRPIRSLQSAYGPISHSGVKVTLEDGSQWLIHKGDTGTDSQMVVTSAENMSSKWKSVEAKEINGRRTVAEFVKAGGDTYDVHGGNCHHATEAMMNL